MKFIVFISSLIFVQAVIHNDEVVINDKRHHIEVVYEIDSSTPDTLCVDYTTNNLYFRVLGSIVGRLDLNTGKYRYIEGVSSASDIVVDQETHDVYIGATDGIYIYNPNTDVVELAGAAGVNVWAMYLKGILYYNPHDTNTVYTLVDGQSINTLELDAFQTDNVTMQELLVDNEENIYFSFGTELYRQKIRETKAVVVYNGYIYAIAMDKNGHVYFSAQGGIFKVLQDSDTVKKVISTDDCVSLTFDAENNFILSNPTSIYRLKPDVEISELKRKIDDFGEHIDNLETKIDKQLAGILEQLLHRTIRTDNSLSTLHLDNQNISVNDTHR